ncbi:hypothetical protein PTTG_26886 [Puccinia triticina 1-1 BBBD Race 1]|uniref:Uncharacterized protein n=1 Tax=Puccinia triticina (isolate 1-1 / race 1 (BBBD)) TaxID=630390 RepID=A0A180GQY9_PUCT1|nr:hypothetical protein PTTG_26886 [Puccinia triticina 1-1 BBBD Race 1]WAR56577.1 hypothetical protein PtB15_7B426 [Puccinia triticina]
MKSGISMLLSAVLLLLLISSPIACEEDYPPNYQPGPDEAIFVCPPKSDPKSTFYCVDSKGIGRTTPNLNFKFLKPGVPVFICRQKQGHYCCKPNAEYKKEACKEALPFDG